ncbi:MAG: acylglycerol kinase family protein, partial [Acidimicrobiales bacterium]
MRVTLIVNPFASSVTPRTRVRIQQLLSADHELEVIETTKGGHAIRLAHWANRAGADVVVALGGDGTINEVANGLLDAPPAGGGQSSE